MRTILSNEEYEGILHAGMLTSSKEDSRNVNRRIYVDGHPPPSSGLRRKISGNPEKEAQVFG